MQVLETSKLSRKMALDSKNITEATKNIRTAKFSMLRAEKTEQKLKSEKNLHSLFSISTSVLNSPTLEIKQNLIRIFYFNRK